jgi:Sulfotransferase domain
MTVKVFQIGFNKCGTRTIHQFFRAQGFRGVHWDEGHLAQALFRNLSNGYDLLRGYEEFDVFTDMECVTREYALEGFKLFPFLARDYPDALYILNTRDREDWIKSRFHHGNGHYLKKWKRILDIEDDAALADVWRVDWDRHHARAQEFFAGKPYRFVKFDIAKDSPERIANLIPEHRLDITRYYQVGRTKSKTSAVDADADE